MRKTLALTASICLLTMTAIGWAAAQQARPATTASAAPATIDEALMALRADLQGGRADILAKNMTLDSQLAAKFWPMYEMYQKEQDVIMDEQLKGIQRYVDNYETLDDAGARGLIEAHFTRDQKMNALRQKWFGDFQKVLGTKLAVRAMQIDRRLSLAHQMEFASRIPLSH